MLSDQTDQIYQDGEMSRFAGVVFGKLYPLFYSYFFHKVSIWENVSLGATESHNFELASKPGIFPGGWYWNLKSGIMVGAILVFMEAEATVNGWADGTRGAYPDWTPQHG